MVYRHAAAFALVALGFALGHTWTALGQPAQRSFHHPGRVLDIQRNTPVDASVKAWPQSEQSGSSGDCPIFGSEPDDATTAIGGQFLLNIDKSKRTYTVTYCASGYVPRADRDIPNHMDNRVIPFPVQLVRMSPDSKEAVGDAIERRVIALLNDLAYLKTVDPSGFSERINTLASDVGSSSNRRAGTIRALAELVQNWGSQ
jgi:hypothetical protein